MSLNLKLLKTPDIQSNTILKSCYKWKNSSIKDLPKLEMIKKLIKNKFDNNEVVEDILYFIYELIINAFHSSNEYKMVEKKEFAEDVNVLLKSVEFRRSNSVNFIIKSFNKISEKSINRIENSLNSKTVKDFENCFTSDYISNTGNAGVGLFTINSILKSKYSSNLNFYHDDTQVVFYFRINKKSLNLLKNAI